MRTGDCLTDELLAARATDALAGDERVSADAHLASCEACRVVLSELLRSGGERPRAPKFGRYVLEEVLGAGGMGTVWSAWDPEVARRVAVKVVHDGRAHDPARAQRFLAERQILAALVHPNIARLLDAGATDDGRTWFAMELVDGAPIDAWCRQRSLGVRQRVELMLQVCAAVSHAHAHLVVHRDLKPTNLLVTHEGAPKLVDFGIAKLLVESAELTATGVVPMTPAFAAPEQVTHEAITTATDVYSLGVLLYELLTDTSPYVAPRGDVQSLLRAVRDIEPIAPSAAVAAKDPRRAHELEGDLDAIVLMALRKNPKDRYASVSALADDLRAVLENRPTAARKGSRAYRAAKFVRRNKTPVAASAAAVLALIAGLVATLWQARAASSERDLARARFAEVRALAHSVVFDYHDGIAQLPGSTPLREQLVKDALKYLTSLEASSQGDVSLQVELAQALLKIGDVQGDPFGASLGRLADARASYLEARKLGLQVLHADPLNREALSAVARSYEKAGALHEVGGELETAVASYQLSRTLYGFLLSTGPNDIAAEYAMSLQDISSGQVNTQLGKLDEAEAQLRRAMTVRARVVGRTHDADHRRGLAASKYSLGQVMIERMKTEDALALFAESRAELEGLLKEYPTSARYKRELDTVITGTAYALRVMGRAKEAVEMMKALATQAEAQLAADPQNAVARRDAVVALSALSDMYRSESLTKETLAPLERALQLNAELVAVDPENNQVKFDRVTLLLSLARSQDLLDFDDAAGQHCKQALELAQSLPHEGADQIERVADAWVCFADLYSDRRYLEALQPIDKALELIAQARALSPSSRLAARSATMWLMRGEVSKALAEKHGADEAKRWADAKDAFGHAADEHEMLEKAGELVGKAVAELERARKGRSEAEQALAKR